MSNTMFLRNQDLLTEDYQGSAVFHTDQQEEGIFVVESRSQDPCTLLEPNERFPETWKKSAFATLGKENPEGALVREAEQRFGMSLEQIKQTKRTIGVLTTLAIVFDRDQVSREEDRVKIVIVQRTNNSSGWTPYPKALSRFGGGACGGKHGKGVHGAQLLANQGVKELWEEFHPFARCGDTLVPLDIIPQGHEVDGLKGEFMRSAMRSRLEISERVQGLLFAESGYLFSSDRESVGAKFLSIDGLTKPLIQRIDGQEVCHENVVICDNQKILGNMDWNLDFLLAVRLPNVRPEDLVLRDGETDQRTRDLLNRLIFLADHKDSERAALGESVTFGNVFSQAAVPELTEAFKRILRHAPAIAQRALECV